MLSVAALQLELRPTLREQLAAAEKLMARAAEAGARLVLLPERFAQWLPECETAATSALVIEWLAEQARRHALFLAGGSVLEYTDSAGLPFNTCMLFGPDGREIARYRKIHLFDALVGDLSYGESSAIAAGNEPVCVQAASVPVGLSICYDLRFPELYRTLLERGARIMLLPAGFTRETGQAHWEVLLRARAIDQQCFVLAAGMTGRTAPRLDFFGHSMIVDPWGRVLATLDQGEGVAMCSLDLDCVDDVRRRLPTRRHRQPGVADQTTELA
jgi:predicted amidohydrolase